jgi:CrcB protein
MADRGQTPGVQIAAKAGAASTRANAALYTAVAAGSVIGSVLRWLVGLALPWGTLFVNLTGSFAIGFFSGMTAPGGRWFAGPRLRQFFMTGVCGGYTTFSMFSLETLRMLQQGKLGAAALYVALSLIAWLGAVWAGDAIAMRLNRLKGARP